MITGLAKNEGVDISKYDLMNMRAYYAVGHTLKGYNVSYNIRDGFSCWVLDNLYEVYEVPSKTNNESMYGQYLLFAHNTNYDYYIFGKMRVSLNKDESINRKRLVENVHFHNFGRYEVTFGPNNVVRKKDNGNSFNPGSKSSSHNFGFDSFNERKKAYNTSVYKILSSFDKDFAKHANQDRLNGKEATKIYKKGNKNTDRPSRKGKTPGSDSSDKRRRK